MKWYRSASIGLGTVLVILTAQSQSIAQSTAQPTTQLTQTQLVQATPEANFQAESSVQAIEQTNPPLRDEPFVAATRLQPYIPPIELPAIEGDSIELFLPEVQESVRLVLRLSQRRVYVYQGETLKASYPVAVGRPGWETPTGSYEVIGMLQDPGWTNPFTGEVLPPGPDNPLGDRWIAFWTDGRNYIGFHGTPNPESVGRAASHGCVRMFNEDIRELYEIVGMGTRVVVEN